MLNYILRLMWRRSDKGEGSMSHSTLTDPDAIRVNQAGQFTWQQLNYIRDKYGSLPGWFFLLIFFGLLIVTVLVAGKTLSNSTTLGVIAVVAILVVTAVVDALLG